MNVENISKAIQIKITQASSVQEVTLLSKVLEKLKMGNVRLALNYYDLPNTATVGDLYFVESESDLYYRVFNGWRKGFKSSGVSSIAGRLWSSGLGNSGELGSGAIFQRSSPASVAAGSFGIEAGWNSVSASGGDHTAAIRPAGTAWAWGRNTSGELGDGTTSSRSSPVSVVGGFTDWMQISAGYGTHTAAVRSNGSAWAWGLNTSGQLGDGTTTSRLSPVSVIGGINDWVEIGAGEDHTVAIRADGTAWTWGGNGFGQLGRGNSGAGTSSPVSVVGGFTDWIQVSAGSLFNVGIRFNGTAWAWGNNSSGQLGDNTTTLRSSPVSVVGGFTDWVQISAGSSHTAAVRANGSAWAWGNNSSGRLGDNTTSSRSSPVSVVGGFTDWVQISAGASHTAAVRANGTAWGWGGNSEGRLGNNTTVTTSSPVSVVGGFTNWVQIAAGFQFTVILRSTI